MLSKKDKKLLNDAFAICAAEREEALPSDDQLQQVAFSDDFGKSMKRMYRWEKYLSHNAVASAGRTAVGFASVALVVIICINAANITVQTSNLTGVKMILETHDYGTDITFKKVDEPVAKDLPEGALNYSDFEWITPGYLPEGFRFFSLEDYTTEREYEYVNDSGAFIYYMQDVYTGGRSEVVSTEHSECEVINIESFESFVAYEAETSWTYIAFCDGIYIYNISAEGISKEEALKMAESVAVQAEKNIKY